MSVGKAVGWGLGVCIGIALFVVLAVGTCFTVGVGGITAGSAKVAERQADNDAEARRELVAYLPSLDLAVSGRYTAGGHISITGKLKNRGSKTVTYLKLVVYLKDADGNRIAEDDFQVVYVNDWGIGNDKPLKPNYSININLPWLDPPDGWEEGSFDYQITELRFE